MKRVKNRIKNHEQTKKLMLKKSNIKAINVFKVEKLIANKNYQAATELLLELLANKRDSEYELLLAITYINEGLYGQSLHLFEGLEVDSDRYHSYYATALQYTQGIQVAVEEWSQVKEIKNLKNSQLLNAGLAFYLNEDIDASLEYFELLTEQTKNTNTVWDTLTKKGRWKEAAFYLKRHLETTEEEITGELYYHLGFIYLKQFEYELAIKYITMAIEQEPEANYYLTLAAACGYAGEYQIGIDALYKSELLGTPNQYKVTYLLGSLYLELNDFENASRVFMEYMPQAEISTYDVLTNADYIAGCEAEANGEYELAIELFIKATYGYNGHCGLLFTKIGEMYYLSGDLKNACKYFMLYNISPNFPIYAFNKKGYTKDVVNYSEYYDYLTVDDNFVLYSSFSGASFTASPYAIFKELYKRPGLTHFVLYNGEESINHEIAAMDNVYFVQANSKLHRRISCQAKILITNGTFPYAFIPNDEQIIINTWHGTPIKYLGYDVEEASYLLSRNVRNSFITSTHLVHPNKFTMNAINNSFKLEAASDTKIEVTGYPRQDLMINITEERKQQIKQYLGIDNNKKVVLYAPTYRDSLLVSGEQRDQPMMDAVAKLSEKSEYNFLFKGHYFDESVKNKTNDLDTNELLSIVDVLISDYSSIAIDFMALNRPIIYFTYDLEEYRAERGFYFELETITNSMVSTYDALEAKIAEQLATPKLDFEQIAAAETFCYLDDGQASKRVLDLALSVEPQVPTTKRRVLLYAGNLLTINEHTDKFEKILASYDPEIFDVTILLDESELKKELDESYIDELIARDFRITFYYGTCSRNQMEDAAYTLYKRYDGYINEQHKDYLFTMMKRNAKRLFARNQYDQIDVLETGSNNEVLLMLAAMDIEAKNLFVDESINNLIHEGERFDMNTKLFNEFASIMDLGNTNIKEELINRYEINESKFID